MVGIGCSVGGLEACVEFFSRLPADTGMAFVVVARCFSGLPDDTGMAFVVMSHLHADHKAILPEVLQRYTAMKVSQAHDDETLRPNRVYVIPPDAVLSIRHGRLRLPVPPAARDRRRPVDYFFKHLAQDQREHSVGIIFSGIGTDGTQGLKAIKAETGLALAQAPASARYDAMPRSALGTGMVDIVAPAGELAARLVQSIRHTTGQPRLAPAGAESSSRTPRRMLALLRGRHARLDPWTAPSPD